MNFILKNNMTNKQLKEEFGKIFRKLRLPMAAYYSNPRLMDFPENIISDFWLSKMDLQRKELAKEIIGEIPMYGGNLGESTSKLKQQLTSKYLK